jgi:hypothetical protein
VIHSHGVGDALGAMGRWRVRAGSAASATPACVVFIAASADGVELTLENGPQSLAGGAAVLSGVLSDGEFSKSNMSSSVSANWSRRVRCGRSWRTNGVNGRHHEALLDQRQHIGVIADVVGHVARFRERRRGDERRPKVELIEARARQRKRAGRVRRQGGA